MTEAKTYQSSFEILQKKLPVVFDIRDVRIALDSDRAQASTYCARWFKRDMISPVGPKAGVYFNLVRDPTARETRIKEAVDRVVTMPSIVVGASALHQHGWTTQRPQSIELALPVDSKVRRYPIMNGIETTLRNRTWFRAAIQNAAIGIDEFLTASPEFALVDAIVNGGKDGMWAPDPSDIDIPSEADPQTVSESIFSISRLLNADIEKVKTFVEEIDGMDLQGMTP